MGSNKALNKLLLKLKNYNSNVEPEYQKHYLLFLIIGIFGIIVMGLYFILLAPLKVKYVEISYIVGILVFLIALCLLIKYPNDAKVYLIAQILAFLLIISQESLIVFLLGWNFGTQYYILCILSVPIFERNIRRNTIFSMLIFGITTIVFLMLMIIFSKATPFYVIDINIINAFNIANIIASCTLIGLLRYYFIKLVTNGEKIILQKNEMIISAMNNLEKTQNQLIESEKMAALGQLISGIAHEINTPLSAIKSSINNITIYMRNTLEEKMPQLFKILNEEELSMFFGLLNKSMEKHLVISSKEKRIYRKSIATLLNELRIEHSNNIADTLVDMGIYDEIELYFPLFKNKNSALIIQTCYEISGIMRNSENINISVERASKIILALKSYGHNDKSGETVESDIIEGLETVLSLYSHNIKQGTEIIRDYKTIRKIHCYPDELNQVWTNIIINALQSMKYKGIIEICVYEEGTEIIIKIMNNGAGIPPEIQPKIFEPFFTTKSQGEGTGLGLDIVKKIILKHNGNIAVESIPGRTSFIIKLPIT